MKRARDIFTRAARDVTRKAMRLGHALAPGRTEAMFGRAIRAKLRQPVSLGQSVLTIKEPGIETMPIMPVAGHIQGGEIEFFFPGLSLVRYERALVFPGSDFVVVGDEAVWAKRHHAQFTKVIPQDKDLVHHEGDELFVRKPDRLVAVDAGFSLCGVHSTIWSHFLVQHLPKTRYLGPAVDHAGGSLTLIVPTHTDHQLQEILRRLTSERPGLKVLALRDGEAALCKILYHIDNTAWISDHSSYVSPSDIVIPRFTLDFLKDGFVSDPAMFPARKALPAARTGKLYLSRKGIRNLECSGDVEAFFRAEGFTSVSPETLSLDEKHYLFAGASFIAGPASSAFTNIIFCAPGTRMMAFWNFQRSYDLYIAALSRHFGIHSCAVSGVDRYPANPHSSYRIAIDRVVEVYRKLLAEPTSPPEEAALE